jgi:serine/threonine protein kinase
VLGFTDPLVLYSRKDGSWKLTDFGFSKHVSSKSLGFTSSGYGTTGYYAPELLLPEGSYDRKVDIWSFGCILYELAVGRRLFEDNGNIVRYQETSDLPAMSFSGDALSIEEKQTIRSTITRMVSLDPKERPAVTHLINEFSANLAQTPDPTPKRIQVYEEFRTTLHKIGTIHDETALSMRHTKFKATQKELPVTPQESIASEPDVQSSRTSAPINFSTLEAKMAFIGTVIEKDRSNYWSWHALSGLYAEQDNLQGAIEAFGREFDESNSRHNAAICMELMNLYAADLNYPKAIEQGSELLKLDPYVIRQALESPNDPRVQEMIPNFKAKEQSLELYVAIFSLSDL